jgi:hypothetical protein
METTKTETTEVKNEVSKLDANSKLTDVIAKVNELVEKANAKRDRGPSSTREMTEADARELIFGKYKDMTHGKAAEATGLSYGQVYSCRGGFTYKKVYAEWKKSNPNREMAGPTK